MPRGGGIETGCDALELNPPGLVQLVGNVALHRLFKVCVELEPVIHRHVAAAVLLAIPEDVDRCNEFIDQLVGCLPCQGLPEVARFEHAVRRA